jgi:hypothetical protein
MGFMRWMAVLWLLVACGDPNAHPDASIDSERSGDLIDAMIDTPPIDPNNPPTLFDTGLCVDAACTQIAPGIRAFTPQFQLWSDSATKKRWIYLPPGTQIDTSNMDFWQFPVGTKLWKEFTRGTTRVETRLVMRIGAGNTNNDWFYVAYVWNAAQNATTAEPFGVLDANGTEHDVPGRILCRQCHDNTQPSRVLGFSAIQLDWDNPDANEYDLQALVAANLLTNQPPSSGGVGGYYPVPGNITEKPALGYLHANCGHCHNPNSRVYTDNMMIRMQLRLTVGTLTSVGTTPAYTTAVNQNAQLMVGGLMKIVTPMQPSQSALFFRFQSTNPAERMPAVGSEMMDPTGETTLRDWITNIP